MRTTRIKTTVAAVATLATVAAFAAVPDRDPRPPCEVEEVEPRTHYRICGADHLIDDAWKMRAPGPAAFPSGPAIVAVGDSFTYGQGVEQAETWPAVLSELLGEPVVNAGRFGANAADIADTVRRFMEPSPAVRLSGNAGNLIHVEQPVLRSGRMVDPWPTEPTVFLYAAYGNDVTASWEDGRDARFYEDQRRFLARRYRERADAFRAELRQLVANAHGVPVLGLVIWQRGERWWLLDAMERDMEAAGMTVVPATYLDEHAGADWTLAPNEHHANPAGHRVYAEAFAAALKEDR